MSNEQNMRSKNPCKIGCASQRSVIILLLFHFLFFFLSFSFLIGFGSEWADKSNWNQIPLLFCIPNVKKLIDKIKIRREKRRKKHCTRILPDFFQVNFVDWLFLRIHIISIISVLFVLVHRLFAFVNPEVAIFFSDILDRLEYWKVNLNNFFLFAKLEI